MTRLPMVDPDSNDPVLKPVFERLKKRWGAVLNLYRLLGWSPLLVKAWGAFAWSLRFELSVSRRLRELMVVRIAEALSAKYEYQHHVHMALEEGISAEQIAALSQWQHSELFSDEEKLVLQLADELAMEPGASAATMRNLQNRFSESDIMELLVTGAYYCGVARVVNSLDLDLEAGHEHLRARNVPD
jgi:4-carboxymuconolactone decarboxylase